MSEAPRFEEFVARFRAAIAAGAYPQAVQLLSELHKSLEAALLDAAEDPRRMSALADEARDILRWADRMVRVGRAHALLRYQRLPRALPYGHPCPGRLNSRSLMA